MQSKKLVVVGDGGSGKTCLLIVFHRGEFPERYVPTVFENYITTVPHPTIQSTSIELALWDTAGQEEYDRLRPLSYPETDVILVCFAIDSHASLANVIDKWAPEVKHFCPSTPVILVGLKSDLRQNERAINVLRTQGQAPITFQQANAAARDIGADYIECSAREKVGVQDVFDRAIELACCGNDLSTQKGLPAFEYTSRKSKRLKCTIL